jgi:Lrp/AsnC family transcriptional regulator, leucine-responsive regulatory protein
MDAIDAQLLELLGRNARARLTDLAAQVQLSVPSVKRRVDRLERSGVIRGYVAVIDPDASPTKLEALIEVFLTVTATREDLLDLLQRSPEIHLAFTIAGDADVVLLVRCDDSEHLEALLIRLRAHPGIARTRSQLLLAHLFERPSPLRGTAGAPVDPR